MEIDIEELLEAPFKNESIETLDSPLKRDSREEDDETKLLYSFDMKNSNEQEPTRHKDRDMDSFRSSRRESEESLKDGSLERDKRRRSRDRKHSRERRRSKDRTRRRSRSRRRSSRRRSRDGSRRRSRERSRRSRSRLKNSRDRSREYRISDNKRAHSRDRNSFHLKNDADFKINGDLDLSFADKKPRREDYSELNEK